MDTIRTSLYVLYTIFLDLAVLTRMLISRVFRQAAGEEYSIRVCRSTSVSGPYVDANGVSCTASGGTMVLASHDYVYGPGGQGIMVDSTEGGAVLYYHYGKSLPRSFVLLIILNSTVIPLGIKPLMCLLLNSRHEHWPWRWRLPVWMERALLEHRVACSLLTIWACGMWRVSWLNALLVHISGCETL